MLFFIRAIRVIRGPHFGLASPLRGRLLAFLLFRLLAADEFRLCLLGHFNNRGRFRFDRLGGHVDDDGTVGISFEQVLQQHSCDDVGWEINKYTTPDLQMEHLGYQNFDTNIENWFLTTCPLEYQEHPTFQSGDLSSPSPVRGDGLPLVYDEGVSWDQSNVGSCRYPLGAF